VYDGRPGLRPGAVEQLNQAEQVQAQARARSVGVLDTGARSTEATTVSIPSAWTSIGPAPIPNGQTEVNSVAVSGRVSAIAVHPTNPNKVYVGTAQGGVYRSLDGGATWTQLMETAQSLAIGSIAIAPSNPTTVYVGTGEPNFSCDSYFGVGLY